MDIITKYNCKFSIPVEHIGKMELLDITDYSLYQNNNVSTMVNIEFNDGTLMTFVLLESDMKKFTEEYKRIHKCRGI